jgi:nucleotide-binding universal stress UspA family protein
MADPTIPATVVTAASAAVAAASAASVTLLNPPDADNLSATAALVAYLRLEADLAEEKARRLRQQANHLAQKFGISITAQEAYGKSNQTMNGVWEEAKMDLMVLSNCLVNDSDPSISTRA